jgi:hypothetical protein
MTFGPDGGLVVGAPDGSAPAGADAAASTPGNAAGTLHGWVNRTPDVLPTSWPSARIQPAVVYDRSFKRVVVYGGYASEQPVQDTWQWDGTTGLWTQVPVAPPSMFDMFGATWDDADESVMIFGGETFPGAAPSNELWSYARKWNAVTSCVPGAPWPPAQLNALLAYDAARARLVLVGSGTWEWDVNAHAWSDRSTAVSPANNQGAFAWDERRHVGVFFGDGPWGVTWEWDGVAGTWSQKQSGSASPAPRTLSAAAYDSDTGRVMLFGGRGDIGGAGSNDWANDLWEWDGTSWTLLDSGDAVAPPDVQGHGLTYDSDRHCLVLFGGNTPPPTGDVSEIWEWHR